MLHGELDLPVAMMKAELILGRSRQLGCRSPYAAYGIERGFRNDDAPSFWRITGCCRI